MVLRICAAVVAWAAICGIAQARLGPHFDLHEVSVRATHIVIATMEAMPVDTWKVVESWKGDLESGEILNLAGISRSESFTTDRIEIESVDHSIGARFAGVERLPSHADHDRVVLFLIKDGNRWMPASITESFEYSAAWIEDGLVFADHAFFSPMPTPRGRRRLYYQMKSESQLRDRIIELMSKPLPELYLNQGFAPNAVPGEFRRKLIEAFSE